MNLGWFGDETAACLLAFAAAAGVAALAGFGVRPLAARLGAIDVPGGRHAHRAPTPRLGGLAILLAVLLAVPLPLRWLAIDGGEVTRHVLPILGIGALVCLLGARDDVRALRPSRKLLGLAAAAAALVGCGVRVRFVELPWLGRLELGPVGAVVTVVWVLACTNAVNLIDGVDGLGAGLAMVASSVLALVAIAMGDLGSAVMLFALGGACAGFLLHNREPARIFLGDSGSLLLGFLLAAISVSGSTKRTAAVLLVAALCALAVPLFDSTHAFVRRFRKAFTTAGRRRLWRALQATAVGDRGHLHHRLLFSGLSHRQVARAVALTTLTTSLAALLLLPTGAVDGTTICGGLLAAGYVVWRLAARRPEPAAGERELLLPRAPLPAEPAVLLPAPALRTADALLPVPQAPANVAAATAGGRELVLPQPDAIASAAPAPRPVAAEAVAGPVP